jgi:phenol/toluene 2-monooxygenase (NADH) P1/A1
MSIDIKTATIEAKRITFDHIAEKLGEGKKPTRYQEVVFGHQAQDVFHYRPTWEPEYELFDARRTAIVLKDFDDLLDPRQYYYGAYVIQRSKQRESQEKNFSVVEKRGLLADLDAVLIEKIKKVVVPFRHVEWAANNNNYFIAGYGFGTPITTAATFQGMDRLGNAQYLTGIGLIISDNDPAILDQAKDEWLNDPMWQGLRKIVEDSFVTKDWFELHVLQNYLLDGVLHPLLFNHMENDVVRHGGAAFAMLTEFFVDWFAESQRWTDSTIKVAVKESEDNRALIEGWLNKWQPQVVAATEQLAQFIFADRSKDVMQQIMSEFDARSKKIGIIPGR